MAARFFDSENADGEKILMIGIGADSRNEVVRPATDDDKAAYEGAFNKYVRMTAPAKPSKKKEAA